MTDFKIGDKVLLPRKHPAQSIESRLFTIVKMDNEKVDLQQGVVVIDYPLQYLVKYEGKDNANSSK